MASNNNNNHNNEEAPFWEFFNPQGNMRAGAGVDHANVGPQLPSGFPFDTAQFNNAWLGHGWGRWGGGSPWGHHGHGWHGRGSHPDFDVPEVPDSDGEDTADDTEMGSSPDTMRQTPGSSATGDHPPPPPPGAFPHHPPPPPGAFPHHPPPPHGPFHHGPPHPFGPHRAHRGRGGRGSRSGRRGRHGPHQQPPMYEGPWDFRPLMHAFASHPFAQTIREYVDQARSGPAGESHEQQHEESAFLPPVDIFNTEKAYILHISLPGAQKEDIGVNWDGDKVNVAGVVYRPGNEEFLQSLASSERKVGMFERSIKLPPPGSDDKEDIDGLGITAKMENGILIVTVPKTEKEWTAIHKVDIE